MLGSTSILKRDFWQSQNVHRKRWRGVPEK